jgi:hypothetical protein
MPVVLLQLKPAGVSQLVQRVLDIEGKAEHWSLKDRWGKVEWTGRGGDGMRASDGAPEVGDSCCFFSSLTFRGALSGGGGAALPVAEDPMHAGPVARTGLVVPPSVLS